jgi:protein-S-isoprenylcysteine O-methyltransferase Ste14
VKHCGCHPWPCSLVRPGVVGFGVGLAGAALLAWASVLLGRFLMHEAAVREDHDLVVRGPYRLIRHPVSLLGILIQGESEEQLLRERFGRQYERYAGRVGRLVPRLRTRATERGCPGS